jgi:hypothetical protein
MATQAAPMVHQIRLRRERVRIGIMVLFRCPAISAAPKGIASHPGASCKTIKVFMLFFLQKKKISLFLFEKKNQKTLISWAGSTRILRFRQDRPPSRF